MPFCKNHDHIYFDKLCRTKKAETVLSLIYATDQAKKFCKGNKELEKKEIAKHLVSAYQLFKFDSGTYTGRLEQFESQYTIGHELGIWRNSDLDLTPLAQKVADNKMTIREYFDIIFLNYIQPVKGKIIHILGSIIEHAIQDDLKILSKDEIKKSFIDIENRAEDINAIYNMLLGTTFFSEISDGLQLNYNAKDIYECCNLEYVGKEYDEVKEKFKKPEIYLQYLLNDHRSEVLLLRRHANKINNIEEKTIVCDHIRDDFTVEQLGEILTNMYETAANKVAAIHIFGIKYGAVIKNKNYNAAQIINASKINGSYHVEVNKGLRIYDSIENNEFGVAFAKEKELEIVSLEPFPRLMPRVDNMFPLNQILYGAPGTGKTYATAQYAVAILENRDIDDILHESRTTVMERYNSFKNNGRIIFTTFHQNYGYEDFVQGIRPDTSGTEMIFKEVDGIFKVIAQKAMLDKDNNYVLVIDEINRANISKTFGELITLIEEDKRWGERNALSILLPSGEPFAVPNNLYIIGTMNSADKSISLIDAALRRRFVFIEFVPDCSLIDDMTMKEVLRKLNYSIEHELGSSDLLIGHSYFINRGKDDIADIMNHTIIPLLYEYYFDDKKKIEKTLHDALDGLGYFINTQAIGRIHISKEESKNG